MNYIEGAMTIRILTIVITLDQNAVITPSSIDDCATSPTINSAGIFANPQLSHLFKQNKLMGR